jgi:hypothetical protein
MRMLLPGVRVRRRVQQLLVAYFDHGQDADFAEALRLLVEFYKLTAPRVDWYIYLDRGKALGYTFEDGHIELILPEHWRQMKPTEHFQPTCARWVNTVLHELYHYLHFVEEERKADNFARQFVTGLKTG